MLEPGKNTLGSHLPLLQMFAPCMTSVCETSCRKTEVVHISSKKNSLPVTQKGNCRNEGNQDLDVIVSKTRPHIKERGRMGEGGRGREQKEGWRKGGRKKKDRFSLFKGKTRRYYIIQGIKETLRDSLPRND